MAITLITKTFLETHILKPVLVFCQECGSGDSVNVLTDEFLELTNEHQNARDSICIQDDYDDNENDNDISAPGRAQYERQKKKF